MAVFESLLGKIRQRDVVEASSSRQTGNVGSTSIDHAGHVIILKELQLELKDELKRGLQIIDTTVNQLVQAKFILNNIENTLEKSVDRDKCPACSRINAELSKEKDEEEVNGCKENGPKSRSSRQQDKDKSPTTSLVSPLTSRRRRVTPEKPVVVKEEKSTVSSSRSMRARRARFARSTSSSSSSSSSYAKSASPPPKKSPSPLRERKSKSKSPPRQVSSPSPSPASSAPEPKQDRKPGPRSRTQIRKASSVKSESKEQENEDIKDVETKLTTESNVNEDLKKKFDIKKCNIEVDNTVSEVLKLYGVPIISTTKGGKRGRGKKLQVNDSRNIIVNLGKIPAPWLRRFQITEDELEPIPQLPSPKPVVSSGKRKREEPVSTYKDKSKGRRRQSKEAPPKKGRAGKIKTREIISSSDSESDKSSDRASSTTPSTSKSSTRVRGRQSKMMSVFTDSEDDSSDIVKAKPTKPAKPATKKTAGPKSWKSKQSSVDNDDNIHYAKIKEVPLLLPTEQKDKEKEVVAVKSIPLTEHEMEMEVDSNQERPSSETNEGEYKEEIVENPMVTEENAEKPTEAEEKPDKDKTVSKSAISKLLSKPSGKPGPACKKSDLKAVLLEKFKQFAEKKNISSTGIRSIGKKDDGLGPNDGSSLTETFPKLGTDLEPSGGDNEMGEGLSIGDLVSSLDDDNNASRTLEPAATLEACPEEDEPKEIWCLNTSTTTTAPLHPGQTSFNNFDSSASGVATTLVRLNDELSTFVTIGPVVDEFKMISPENHPIEELQFCDQMSCDTLPSNDQSTDFDASGNEYHENEMLSVSTEQHSVVENGARPKYCLIAREGFPLEMRMVE